MEVLVSMVIVAVGLFGLQALGIVAARGLAIADSRSRYATLASDSLASALHQLRRGVVPSQFCSDGPREGERFGRTVDVSESRLAHITVTIEPATESFGSSAAFTIGSSVFMPANAMGNPPGGGCG